MVVFFSMVNTNYFGIKIIVHIYSLLVWIITTIICPLFVITPGSFTSVLYVPIWGRIRVCNTILLSYLCTWISMCIYAYECVFVVRIIDRATVKLRICAISLASFFLVRLIKCSVVGVDRRRRLQYVFFSFFTVMWSNSL